MNILRKANQSDTQRVGRRDEQIEATAIDSRATDLIIAHGDVFDVTVFVRVETIGAQRRLAGNQRRIDGRGTVVVQAALLRG